MSLCHKTNNYNFIIIEMIPTLFNFQKQKTGKIEVIVSDLKVLNMAKNLPFSVRDFNKPNESIRMKYRYLDLRYPNMQHNLRLRSKIIHNMRKYLIEHLDFVEVETPTLFKRTPGVSALFFGNLLFIRIKFNFLLILYKFLMFRELKNLLYLLRKKENFILLYKVLNNLNNCS